MDYEKAYKEALERAKMWQEHLNEVGYKDFADELNYIFSGLRESEDEKIRKALLEHIARIDCEVPLGAYHRINGVDNSEIIAWLEKQGKKQPIIEMKSPEESLGVSSKEYNEIVNDCLYREDKVADKIEQKFKVGDWITNDYCAGKVIELTNDAYLLDTGQGIPFSCEHNVHLWTIQDAKDGHVLAAHECIVLFKEIDGLNIKCHCTYHFMNNPSFYVNTLQNKSAFHPATKEQRELLFQKMQESGYEWDAEKKELKKIHVIDEGKAEMDYCFTKMMNGEKVSPSEENEEYNGEDYGIDSLYHAQRILEKTLGNVDGYQTDDGILSHKCAITAVKKLYKQKPTWSEEDEYMLNETIQHLEELIRIDKAKHLGCDVQYYQRDIDWLKHIEQRIGG